MCGLRSSPVTRPSSFRPVGGKASVAGNSRRLPWRPERFLGSGWRAPFHGMSQQDISSTWRTTSHCGPCRSIPEQLSVTGSPVAVLEDLTLTAFGDANVRVSDSGRLIYISGTQVGSLAQELVTVDRQGQVVGPILDGLSGPATPTVARWESGGSADRWRSLDSRLGNR